MSVEKDIPYEVLAVIWPNSTGAELHGVCTEIGVRPIRARRKIFSEKYDIKANWGSSHEGTSRGDKKLSASDCFYPVDPSE